MNTVREKYKLKNCYSCKFKLKVTFRLSLLNGENS